MQPLETGRVLDLGTSEEEALGFDLLAIADQRHERFEHQAKKLEQFLPRGFLACKRRLHPCRQRRHLRLGVLDNAVDDGPVEPFLAAVIILNGRQVHAGALGQNSCAGALVTFGSEDLERSVEDTPPRVLPARLGRWTITRDESLHGPAIAGADRTISIDRLSQSIAFL